MQDQRLAVHRTIVVVDVEGFGDQRRTNRDQVTIRDGLYRAMREAFGRAGIAWDDCGHEDRGDGVFVLVPAEVPKGLLAESLPSALVTALHAHNDTHSGPEQIRLSLIEGLSKSAGSVSVAKITPRETPARLMSTNNLISGT